MLLSDLITDMWRFSTKRFNTTNVLVSGWNVIAKHQEPIFTSMPVPATGTLGKHNTQPFVSKIFIFMRQSLCFTCQIIH